MTDVPCNGCTACCRRDLLVLHPEYGDDPSQYETEKNLNPVSGQIVDTLKHQPNGDCIYLDRASGCTIHGRAPSICRQFDCRRFYLKVRDTTTRKERRKMVWKGHFSKEVLKAGRQRIATLMELA